MISLDHWIIELGFQQLVVSEAEAMRVSDLCNQSDDLMVSVRDLIDLDFATEVRINADQNDLSPLAVDVCNRA